MIINSKKTITLIPKIFLLLTVIFSISGCSIFFENKDTSYPKNACLMLKENKDWLRSLHKTNKKWGVPISVQLAIIYHESSFYHKARPINHSKKSFLQFWKKKYLSTAYGFSQALDGTWYDYMKSTKNYGADRDSFKDSTDFIGWYADNASKVLGLKKNDAKYLYLAYHEGLGGYRKGSYKKKKWLMSKSNKVRRSSVEYSKEINKCKLRY
jgi:hypothetical protein